MNNVHNVKICMYNFVTFSVVRTTRNMKNRVDDLHQYLYREYVYRSIFINW